MANLSSLIHELRERIAASASSSSSSSSGEDPLETKFRTVLPNLLHAYVVPSSTANEREVTAVLKLLSHTARNFPGVFFHGRAAAVLPVIGRVLPFLSEPAFRSRHGVIFETIASLLLLLRTGEREAYRQFFLDAMVVVEDVVYIASNYAKESRASSDRVALKCFRESLSLISDCPVLFSELPACCRPTDGPGVLVDLTDKMRWQPFAAWMIRLVNKCLMEGTLHVEGLINISFAYAACSLLCYGDATLHMACFDFARIAATVVDADIIPVENIIRSITCILCQEDNKFVAFRNTTYDSSMGACLHVLHSLSQGDIVESTSNDIVNAFSRSICTTKSPELQVAICSAYIRIAKSCPPQIWKPKILVKMLCLSRPSVSLIECMTVAIGILRSNRASCDEDNVSIDLSLASSKGCFLPKVGDKRLIETDTKVHCKRLKTTVANVKGTTNFLVGPECTSLVDVQKEESANELWRSIALFLELSKPIDSKASALKPGTTITALSILCLIFSAYPHDSLSSSIFHQVLSWVPWICKQVKCSSVLLFDLPTYLQAVHSILCLQGLLQSQIKFFQDDEPLTGTDTRSCIYPKYSDLLELLILPWTYNSVIAQSCLVGKVKCLSIQSFSKIGMKLKDEANLSLLDLAIHDEDEEVCIEAVASIPVIILFSGQTFLESILRKLESVGQDRSVQINKSILFSIGYISCLLGTSNSFDDQDRYPCKLFLGDHHERHICTMDLLLRGFWCPHCDKGVVQNKEQPSKVISMPMLQRIKADCGTSFVRFQTLFFEFLCYDSTEEFQVACVQILPRILRHSSEDVLLEMRSKWNDCIDYLLLHKVKAIRDAFCMAISCFLEDHTFVFLFSDVVGSGNTKEQRFVDKLKDALTVTDDPEVLVTLLESTAAIMNASDIHEPLFFYSLLLFIDQIDNHNQIVKMTALRLIHKSPHFCLKGGFEQVLCKISHIRDELYEYLSSRLVTRPAMIREFAETVLGIKIEEFIGNMVPLVVPKLVVSHRVNNQAIIILHELASYLNMDFIPLIVNWLPKVLAFALLRADGEELSTVLEFYHVQTGSDNKELFAAALPALLDELLCFSGEVDMDEINTRTSRIPMMVEEVAKILTSSDDLPSFLKNNFVGLLNSIDRKMLHSEDLWLQKQALKRIEKLIEMMGSYLSTHVPKIMVLLMYAIDKEALQAEGLTLLHFFITQLAKLSPSSTKHVLSQVVAAFIPCLEKCKENPSAHLKEIVRILEDLVVENRLILKQHIKELPLLPSLLALSEVNKVIQDARGSTSLQDQLQDAVDGLNHESLNVRYMMACELSKLLNLRREEVTALIADDSIVNLDVASSLISSLLRGCAEESRTAVGQRLKLVCADCLGALGAVDPAKLKGISCERFKIECSDDDLIFELIDKHLARTFRAASDTIVQDSAALAIQELLKLAGCQASLGENICNETLGTSDNRVSGSMNDMNMRGQKLWGRFSNYVKEIIAPCLTSRFQLPIVTDSNYAGPVYRPSMSFRRWIFFWIRKLTAHSTGPRSSIFSACRGIVRRDMQTSSYLLPYLVLNVVSHGTLEARHSITEEILSVLNAAVSGHTEAAVHGSAGGQNEVCIQAVFTLLDNLGQWVDDLKQETALSQTFHSSASKKVVGLKIESEAVHNVSELLSSIPKVTLAKASFRCQAHARALMYFESFVREKSGSFSPAAVKNSFDKHGISGSSDQASPRNDSDKPFADEDISFLMEIYSGLDEPDGLSGLANLREVSRLQDQLLINEKAGNWAEVLTLCEQALQMEPSSVQRHSDFLNCLLNMCHLQAMVTHVDGLISRIPQYKKTWCMQGVQAAWRLGRWDLMDEYLSSAEKEGLVCNTSESNASFDMSLAKIIQAMMKKDQFMVAERIAQSKQTLLAPLAAAGMDSYVRAYPYIVKLHMLCELEDYSTLLGVGSFLDTSFTLDDPKFLKVTKDWENRLRFTQPSLWAREPLLALRRLVFSANNLSDQVGNCWLQYAKLCRSAGHYETAHQAILEAHASGAQNVHMEKAKLLWSNRKSDHAIAELQPYIPDPDTPIAAQAPEGRDLAKIILLYTRWIHYTGQKQKEEILMNYSRVRDLQPKWEKGYFFMAKYCDDLLVDARKRQEDNLASCGAGSSLNPSTEEKPWWTYLPDVLLFYAKGLHKGHKNLFQALPRLLTLWFEFGSIYHRDGSSNKPMRTVFSRILSIMRGCLKDLPTYQWLTVLSQLVSRICHQNDEIVRIVKHIITSVLQSYPQQALWMMAAVSKSTVAARRDAAAEIIQAARRGSRAASENSGLFIQFASLIDHLIRLCFHPGQPKSKTINISTEFSALKRMMPLGIILPVQQALTVTLPAYDASQTDSPSFDAFSACNHAMISGIGDEAEILSSLQRPKKVVFLGSDGVQRPFLCKPKDDLRKDARMMEFTAMINRLLSKFPESRRRKLYIRTFAVIPLTEDCGMVEWVPHTRGLRHILQDIYITCGKFDRQKTNPKIKSIYDQRKTSEEEMLKSQILPMFPPVFHKWFLTTFSEPAAWFRARVAYAHTCAVWSMVGHIVGLGDRHGENILFDSTTGDCIHVDFSCLFDRGLLLDKPELVPFRLTQNMIDGLGITGYKGVFLKVCEITLSVLRTHRETLMSVLETFLHDPLVEWTKSHKSSGVEVQNPHAQRAISNIKARLQGIVVGVGAAPSLPLAVEGQAQRLIEEAISLKNLGKMYIWWMAWF